MTLAIRRQGEPDWIRAYGYADLEVSLPTSPDTVYQIGSLSMQFTAAAVMQLVERGQLDLHAPIGQYLEGLPEKFQSFTLHQLLTHTSLIYDSAWEMQEKFFGQQDFTSQTLLEELVPSLSLRSVDDPFFFAYGNYILAGLIVEKVSGLRYPDYLSQYVIAPAGLQHTSYCLPPPPGVAKGYYMPEGVLQPLKLNVSAVFAAGGLCSTAGDLLQWMSALTSGKVVSPQSYQQIITPAQLPNGTSTNYGYGLMISQEDNLVIFVYGSEASYVTYLFSFPQKGLTFVLLSNTSKPENDLFGKIWESLPSLF
jgi:CubicO group peptidase (beta-lactamase class C family)